MLAQRDRWRPASYFCPELLLCLDWKQDIINLLTCQNLVLGQHKWVFSPLFFLLYRKTLQLVLSSEAGLGKQGRLEAESSLPRQKLGCPRAAGPGSRMGSAGPGKPSRTRTGALRPPHFTRPRMAAQHAPACGWRERHLLFKDDFYFESRLPRRKALSCWPHKISLDYDDTQQEQ